MCELCAVPYHAKEGKKPIAVYDPECQDQDDCHSCSKCNNVSGKVSQHRDRCARDLSRRHTSFQAIYTCQVVFATVGFGPPVDSLNSGPQRCPPMIPVPKLSPVTIIFVIVITSHAEAQLRRSDRSCKVPRAVRAAAVGKIPGVVSSLCRSNFGTLPIPAKACFCWTFI
jgi:hypothetical protein